MAGFRGRFLCGGFADMGGAAIGERADSGKAAFCEEDFGLAVFGVRSVGLAIFGGDAAAIGGAAFFGVPGILTMTILGIFGFARSTFALSSPIL